MSISQHIEYLRKVAAHSPHPDVHAAFLKLAYAPKFTIKHFDALPTVDQANECSRPPLPFPHILLGFATDIHIVGEHVKGYIVLQAIETPGRWQIQASLLEANKTMPLGDAHTHLPPDMCDLDWKVTPIIEGLEATWQTCIDTFCQFMALLSAENTYVSPPPSTFSRKREQSRIKTHKRVETYHTYTIRVKHSTRSKPSDPTGRTMSAHWRRAHLRHYKAGVGHIKVTKTIVIPPCYIATSSKFTNKDYEV